MRGTEREKKKSTFVRTPYSTHTHRFPPTGLNLPVVCVTAFEHESWVPSSLAGNETPGDVPAPVAIGGEVEVTKGALGATVGDVSLERTGHGVASFSVPGAVALDASAAHVRVAVLLGVVLGVVEGDWDHACVFSGIGGRGNQLSELPLQVNH